MKENNTVQLNTTKKLLLGLQHTFTMFGATVLVPYLTGVPVNVALFAAGVATLLFHLITKGKVPIFLGSSFAYIAPMIAVTLYYINEGATQYGSLQDAINTGMDITPMLAYATGGIVIAGAVKFLFGLIVRVVGVEKIVKHFPPVVSGTTVLIIGIILSPVAIDMASSNWPIALCALVAALIARLYFKGFYKIIPVIIGILTGYMVALVTGNVNLTGFADAGWLALPNFYLPKFSLHAISLIVPVALAAAVESIADVYAVSAVAEKKFYEDPGIDKTLMGDGIGTMLGGFVGAPAYTTYSENTGVLAITKVYNPVVMRIAAVIAIILSFVPKVGFIISSIPTAVMGGIEILLFGMIAAVGLKTLVDNQVKVDGKNLVIIAIMLVLSLGGAKLQLGTFTLEGIGLAVLVGLILNLLFIYTKASEE
ncbi:MAG: uracil-xanthine permease family protein [Thermotogota bacterium]|nr:uracil-xanthine permease family protein [Thermotogota bacterium]